MDIIGLVHELSVLINEEKAARVHINKLRKRKLDVEKSIIKFLNDTNDPGIKCDNLLIELNEKERRLHKKKSEKLLNVKEVLRNYGVANTDTAVNEVISAMKGETKVETKLSIKNVK